MHLELSASQSLTERLLAGARRATSTQPGHGGQSGPGATLGPMHVAASRAPDRRSATTSPSAAARRRSAPGATTSSPAQNRAGRLERLADARGRAGAARSQKAARGSLIPGP